MFIFPRKERTNPKLEDNSLLEFISTGKKKREKSSFHDSPPEATENIKRSHIGIAPQKTAVVSFTVAQLSRTQKPELSVLMKGW